MSYDPRIEMPRYEIMPINAHLRQEQLRFHQYSCPQILATLTEDGKIKELEPIAGTKGFEIPDSIKELAIHEFRQALEYYGFKSKDTDPDCLQITKGVFSMRLETKGQVPFSDVTLHQINKVYDHFLAERNDMVARNVATMINGIHNAEQFSELDVEAFKRKIEGLKNDD